MKALTLISFIFFLSSCTNTSSEEHTQLEQVLEILAPENDINQFDSIIVIPENSCGICVSGSFYFLKHNIDNYSRMSALITSFTSIKNMKLQYGRLIVDHQRTLIDVNNEVGKAKLKITAPTVFLLKDGNVIEKLTIKPSTMNDIFETTIVHLNKNQL